MILFCGSRDWQILQSPGQPKKSSVAARIEPDCRPGRGRWRWLAPSARKSTALHIAGLPMWIRPTPPPGQCEIGWAPNDGSPSQNPPGVRRRDVGFIYHSTTLACPSFGRWKIIVCHSLLNGGVASDAQTRARSLADRVGIGHRAEPPASGAVGR